MKLNKLLNHDEIESLFGKGATITSGRWGLEPVKLLFPRGGGGHFFRLTCSVALWGWRDAANK